MAKGAQAKAAKADAQAKKEADKSAAKEREEEEKWSKGSKGKNKKSVISLALCIIYETRKGELTYPRIAVKTRPRKQLKRRQRRPKRLVCSPKRKRR